MGGTAGFWESPPKLPAFKTEFELDMGTPARAAGAGWPMPSPFTHAMGTTGLDAAQADTEMLAVSGASPGDLSLAPSKYTVDGTARSRGSVMRLFPMPPAADPFVFGSPAPAAGVSNAQFTRAAESVLAEMNARLGLEGERAVTADILRVPRFEPHVGAGAGGSPDRYGRVHEDVFGRMEGIAEYAKRTGRAGTKRKSGALGPGAARASGVRVISNGTRKRMVPGAFDDEDEEEQEEEQERKRPRVTLEGAPPPGEKVKVALSKEEEERRQKKRESLRRNVELNRARRRSSRGMPPIRTSLGRGAQREFYQLIWLLLRRG